MDTSRYPKTALDDGGPRGPRGRWQTIEQMQ
jgi:hypothetical protein